jgi:hypothetical protein
VSDFTPRLLSSPRKQTGAASDLLGPNSLEKSPRKFPPRGLYGQSSVTIVVVVS